MKANNATVFLFRIGRISLRVPRRHFMIFLSKLEYFLYSYRVATSLSNTFDLVGYSAVTPKRHLNSRTNILTEVSFLDDTMNNRSNNWLIGTVHSELVN